MVINMPKRKRAVVYAFIDSQNLNLGTSKNIYKNRKLTYTGWRLDYKKFKVYLRDKFKIAKHFCLLATFQKIKVYTQD